MTSKVKKAIFIVPLVILLIAASLTIYYFQTANDELNTLKEEYSSSSKPAAAVRTGASKHNSTEDSDASDGSEGNTSNQDSESETDPGQSSDEEGSDSTDSVVSTDEENEESDEENENRIAFEDYPIIETPFGVSSNETIGTIRKEELMHVDFLELLENVDIRHATPVGIKNKGDSCFAGSAIQMLYRIPSIRKIVANLEFINEISIFTAAQIEEAANLLPEDGDESWEELKALEDQYSSMTESLKVIEGINYMFHQLHTVEQGTDCSFHYPSIDESDPSYEEAQNDPVNNYKAFQCMTGVYSTNQAQNTIDYMDFILDNLKKILPEPLHFRIEIVLKNDKPSGEMEIEHLYHLNLSVPNENKIIALNDMLNAYCNDQETRRFQSLPDVIPIRPARSPESDESFDMPEEFDFVSYIQPDLFNGSSKYRMMNMFIEIADHHFISYTLESDNKWYRIDDATVTEMDKATINDKLKRGFVYFYERIKE